MCNVKNGIINSNIKSLADSFSNPNARDPKAYGWFNEICLVKGFETKLKRVVAYRTESGIKGKCIIDSLSPYLKDSDSNTNCDSGGMAPNCLCLEAFDFIDVDSDKIIRTQTPREAGLCVDMPEAKTCEAIDYNQNPNPDLNDIEYIISSLNKTFYDNNTGVNFSHKYRTEGKQDPNGILLRGHAEFPRAFFGMTDVEGECKGFWRKNSKNGVEISPTLNCLYVNGDAKWDSDDHTKNQCVRYSCDEISTTGPDINGIYDGAYGINELGEQKGLSNGFALWNKKIKTNDFLETFSSSQCIAGFKAKGSSVVFLNQLPSVISSTLYQSIKTKIGESQASSLYRMIADYTGGILPTRQCNQIGQWMTVNNTCERISCPAINPPIPSGSSDKAAWELWRNSAGATFPSVNASRSVIRIQPESVSFGICNNDLGFFQNPGGKPPTRECDYLGNWGPVINPCVTTCDAISEPTVASSSNNGFSFWNEVKSVQIGGEVDGILNSTIGNSGCVSGYYPYPYPPLKDKYGENFILSENGPYRTDIGTNSQLKTIPLDITQDTRSASYPQRVCISLVTAGGAANVWTNTSSSCINYCPGADIDPRIGVGNTRHNTTYGGITISWPSTKYGQWVFADNPTISQQDASHYFQNRNNKYYSLARYCNPITRKWDSAIPQCATNNGIISSENMQFNSPFPRVPINSIAQGNCVSGYYPSNHGLSPLSKYKCYYKDIKANIDEVYLKHDSGESCKLYCKITSGQEFGNSRYDGKNSLIDVGQRAELACKNENGSQISGGERTNASYDCRRGENGIKSDRNSEPPYVECKRDGSWSLNNNCSPCRSCNSDSPIYGDTSVNVGYVCKTTYSDVYGNHTACNEAEDETYDFYGDVRGISLQNLNDTNRSSSRGVRGVCYSFDGKGYCGCNTRCPQSSAKINIKCVDGAKITSTYQRSWSCRQNADKCSNYYQGNESPF